ncbi:hypothetical protein [Reyranella sp.]|uniref:hypothetical protein n=1 Tax=Reyranella sp. TaxID=1929291 RepID=UPI001227C466|nr:hypothetical protein [Reyranella sp.]TAJ89738.1 MAG: hypothetical protein EPO50_05065 [Reyranella sp.]
MAGIVYPNVIGTLAPLMQLEQSERRNALTERAYAREDEDRAREREVGQHVPAALSGDKDALGRVAAMSPKTAFALAPLLERADAATRTRAKEAAAWTQQAALGVLSAPPEQRPAAYAAALEDGKARGYDISKLPPQYTPDVEGRLNFYVGQARDANKWFEENANRPTPIGPAPGGAPAAAPAGAPGDVVARAGGAISGIESGGRYDAVGPDTGKGQRAYGKYQVMDFNIGPWTQEVFGKPMTPQEFLANPQAQDAVFNHKFGQYVKQYGGPEQAARVWFGGPGGLTNPGAKDVLGTSVDSYAEKFNAGFGAAPQVAGAPAGLPQGDAVRADASGNALPPADETLTLRRYVQSKIPGARVLGVRGEPVYDKQGRLRIQLPDGTPDAIDVPKPQQPSAGYEPNPDGGGLRPIPGGPADPKTAGELANAKRKAEEKAIPQTITKGMQENVNALKQIDRALGELDANPGSTGGVGSKIASVIPGAGMIQNEFGDPQGVKLRALIADIGSLKIHDRSGAAVTASEFPRLRPFIPSIADPPNVVRDKLANFRAEYESMLRDSVDYYSEQNGFRPYTPATDYLSKAPARATTQPTEPTAAPATTPAQAPTVSEGATATNPQTGEKIIFRNGQWTPTR